MRNKELALLLRGQHFHVTELGLESLIECGYFDETIMTPASIKKPTFICIGHDHSGDALCITLDLYKPEYLEYSTEDVHKMAYNHPLTFWVREDEIEVKL